MTPTQFFKVVIEMAVSESEVFNAERPFNKNSLIAVTQDSTFKVPVIIVGKDYVKDISSFQISNPCHILVHPAYSSNLGDARTSPGSAPKMFDIKRNHLR